MNAEIGYFLCRLCKRCAQLQFRKGTNLEQAQIDRLKLHSHQWSSVRGHLRDFPEIGIIKCEICGLVNPSRDLRTQVSYADGTMHEWAQGWGGELSGPSEDLSRRLRAVTSILTKGNSYLDYGCGDGSFLRLMVEITPEAIGMDPDVGATRKARDDGMRIYQNIMELRNLPKFNLISLFHVVEHFYDIPKELNEIKKLLAPKGKLIIETPNADDALLSRYQSNAFSNFTYWSHHPNLCTNKYLVEALEDTGFEVELNSQVQRYGLANHLYWLSHGLPGGHSIWATASTRELDLEYEKHLISDWVADTVWIVAKNT